MGEVLDSVGSGDAPDPGEPVADEPVASEQAEGAATPRGDASEEPSAGASAGLVWTRARVLVPLYAVVSCLLTWPLVGHLAGSLTYGDEPVGTVPLFNLWTLRWNQSRIGDLYSNYWDAPIFHPNDGSFALSEPQPLTGLVFAPVSWLTGNPVLAFNLIFLAIFTLNGYAAARLARHLGAASGPAALTGVMAVGLSFVANEMGVLQLTVVFPLMLLIEAIVRWAPEGGRWPAARIGIWLAVTFLTCGYYGLFAILGIGLPALTLVRPAWLRWSRLGDLALAGAIFAVPTLPFLIGQGRITADYERSDSTIENLSANSWEYRQLVPDARGAGVAPWLNEMQEAHGLYPGTALLVLAFLGFWFGGRQVVRSATSGERSPAADGSTSGDAGSADQNAEPTAGDDPNATGEKTSDDTDPGDPAPDGADRAGEAEQEIGDEPEVELERGLPRFLLTGVVVTWVLSLGLHLEIFGFKPYDIVRSVVPGYATLRSPFRFAALFELFLLGLAAFGLHLVWSWRPRLGPARVAALAGPALAAAVVVLGVAEVSIAPVRLFEVDRTVPGWAEWLGDEAPEEPPAGDGSVAFLPFSPSGRATDYESTTEWMVQALDTGKPMVNGYSGLWPDDSWQLGTTMRGYPNEEADATVRSFGISYLVVQEAWLQMDPSRKSWLSSRYTLVFSDEEASVYEVR